MVVASAVAVLVAAWLVVDLNSSGRDAKQPDASQPRQADKLSSGESAPSADHGATDATVHFADDGLRIAVADETTTTVRRWNHKKRGFGPAEPMVDVVKGSTIPRVDKGPRPQTSLIVHERVGDGVESSLLSTLRKPNGQLMPTASRIWSDRVEITWRFEDADSWTVRRGNEKPRRATGGSFIDRSAAIRKGGRYQIEGQIKAKNVAKGGVDTLSYIVVVPPAPKRNLSATSDDEAWASNFNIATSEKQIRIFEWNSFIENPRIPISFFCDAFSDGYFIGDGRTFALGAGKAFSKKGDPLARLSTRVGSGWDPQDPQLNSRVFDGWIHKAVGVTRELGGDLQQVRRAWAGDDGLELLQSESDSAGALRKVKMAGSDPLCSVYGTEAPDIDVSYTYLANNDGSFLVLSEFDKAPSTEMLWETTSDFDDLSTYRGGCLKYFQNHGFEHLSGFPWKASMIVNFVGEPENSETCEIDEDGMM